MTPLKRSPFIALIVLAIIVVGTGALYLYLVNKSNVFKAPRTLSEIFDNPLNISKQKDKEEPKVASVLDGSFVTADKAKRHPLGVMIENHPDARPQSGLSSASIVYETIAEGGITRFLAIFGPNDASKVGPVRSARTYFVDWCNEFDCFYAHVGGNYDALYEKIPADKVKDLDQFANGSSYHREPKAGIATEHTMYSSTDILYKLAAGKKWSTPIRDSYNSYQFLDDPKSPTTPSASVINIDFSSPQYAVKYSYVTTTNSYARELGGVAHVDANTKQQINVKNIIIQNIDRTAVVTKINESGWAMPTVGKGKMTLYQGGQKIEGTWLKKDSFSRTEFRDSAGKLIELYRGATWIEAVNPGSLVTSKAI